MTNIQIFDIKISIKLLIIFLLMGLVSCGEDQGMQISGDNDIEMNPNIVDDLSRLPAEVTFPNNNPDSERKSELGRLLFWDPILSGNMDIACSTCHHPDEAYADGLERSRGVGGTLIDRNSPTIINTAYNGININGNYNPDNAPMFWDNRVRSLEDQAIQPILSAVEMRGDEIAENEIIALVIDRLNSNSTYLELFDDAFGTSEISIEHVGAALATFQRNITATNSRFDQYLAGDDSALSNQELQGLDAFLDAGCADCHSGPMLSDYQLHTLGVPNNGVNDTGANGRYAFRTPTLRNVALTAPYMHNGQFDDLADVVNFYRNIANRNQNAINNNINLNDIDQDARRLNINRGEINDIVAFLRTLTDEDFDRGIPEQVPSNLPVGAR